MLRRLLPMALLAAALSPCLSLTPALPAQAQDPTPNLTAALSVAPASPSPGGAATFQITLTNGGGAPAGAFWVELAINPATTPTQANQAFQSTLSPQQFLAWEVGGLAEGQSVLLSSDPAATGAVTPNAEYSSYGGSLGIGARSVALYVDSYSNDGSPNGAVFESNEGDNAIQQAFPTSGPSQPRGGQRFLPLIGVAPSNNAPPPDSRFEAALSFRPKPNGFSFENYGSPDNTATTFSATDLERMFGRANVCENANTADPCILTAPARQWREQQAAGLNGGQCYGMAVAASRLFEGSDSPATFAPGATSTFDIQKTEQVQNHIAYYFITQSLSPVDASLGNWLEAKTPAETIAFLRQAFQNNQSYVIGFYKRDKTGGHAVTPYAIQNMGGNIYRLFVYDNNWPDRERFFEFDLNQNTWRYDFGSTVPGQPVDLYEGDARTLTLQLRNMPSHPAGPYQCPFCQGGAGVQQTEPLFFEFDGEARMLLIDPAGRRLGYNPATRQYLREIASADEQPFLGGLGKDIPPYVELPYDPAATQPYQVVLSGNELEELAFGDLTIGAPGLLVGFTDILLEPTDEMTFTISPDLQTIGVSSNSDNAIGMFIAREPTPTQEVPNPDSVLVEIADVDILTGETLSMSFDDQQRLTVVSSTGRALTYDIFYTRIDEEAGDEEWSQDDYSIDAGYDWEMDFSQWDEGETAPIYIDDDGDGEFSDEEPSEVPDEP
jgi:hypothetical protein